MSPLAHKRPALNPDSSLRRIGVIGLGHMGGDFAANLIADGYQVTVYDRNEKHIAPFVAKGAIGAAGIGDLAGCDAVITSVPDDDALADVTTGDRGLINVLAPGAIHISMSTVSPRLSRRLAEAHRVASQSYVAAPVLGNPDLARARKLFLLVAGASPAIASEASAGREKGGDQEGRFLRRGAYRSQAMMCRSRRSEQVSDHRNQQRRSSTRIPLLRNPIEATRTTGLLQSRSGAMSRRRARRGCCSGPDQPVGGGHSLGIGGIRSAFWKIGSTIAGRVRGRIAIVRLERVG